jgi:hypothetical protein
MADSTTRQITTISRYRSKRQESRIIARERDTAVSRSSHANDPPVVANIAFSNSTHTVDGTGLIDTCT